MRYHAGLLWGGSSYPSPPVRREFRKVVQVDDSHRALVHVRYDDADTRTLP